MICYRNVLVFNSILGVVLACSSSSDKDPSASGGSDDTNAEDASGGKGETGGDGEPSGGGPSDAGGSNSGGEPAGGGDTASGGGGASGGAPPLDPWIAECMSARIIQPCSSCVGPDCIRCTYLPKEEREELGLVCNYTQLSYELACACLEGGACPACPNDWD